MLLKGINQLQADWVITSHFASGPAYNRSTGVSKRHPSPTLANPASTGVTGCWATCKDFFCCWWHESLANQHKRQAHNHHILGTRDPQGCHGRWQLRAVLGNSRSSCLKNVSTESEYKSVSVLQRHEINYPDASHSQQNGLRLLSCMLLRGLSTS